MKRLPKPLQNAGITYSICISRVRNPILRQHLTNLCELVEIAAIDYDSKASNCELHAVLPSGQCGDVSAQELAKVYKNRMAKPTAPGRSIYEQLMIVPQGRCPLCGQRDVSTLDHYLPESAFSLLVVTPVNLVPTCKDCNHKKLAAIPTSIKTQTIHPYYDDFDDATWIEACLIDGDPVCVTFSVVHPDGWDNTKYERAVHHFETFELADLYSDHASSELVEVKLRLSELYQLGGAYEIRTHLECTARSITHARKNSWRGALYQAAASSDWFCNGGFLRIAE